MLNILVSGVGAVIGYGVVRCLRKYPKPVRIIGMDIYADAVGQYWCDAFEQAVLTSSPNYPTFLKSVFNKYAVDLFIPAIEQDVYHLAVNKDFYLDIPTKLATNNPELVVLAEDKWCFHLELKKNGFPTIKTYIKGDFAFLSAELDVPFLLKPRRSYASKGIVKIYDEQDLLYWNEKLRDNFMVQEIVGSDDAEYTVSVFGYGNGKASRHIEFQRKLSREGATTSARVVKIQELEDLVDNLVRIFKPIGPTNLQFRYHKGTYLLLEINPRISSSTSIREKFGVNEALMCIEYYIEKSIPQVLIEKTGSVVRYIEDYVINDSSDIRHSR